MLCLSVPSYASKARLSKSTLSTLIDQPVIAALFRDKFGLLWIGTQEGLYRYDGANLVLFNSDGNNKNWIPSSDIRGIAEDVDGNLLVATYGGGLLRWDSIENSFVPSRDLNTDEDYQLTHLHVASGGNVWIGTKDKIFLYNRDFHSSANWYAVPEITKTVGSPYTFAENNSDELIVGGSAGLSKFSIHNKVVTKFDLSALGIQGNIGVTAIEFENTGNLIIGTDTGNLAVLDVDSGVIVAQATLGKNSPKFVSDFAFHENKLVIATDEGLYSSEIDLSNIEEISLQGAGLSSSDIVSLYQDGDHVWVGTYNGLDILSSGSFELFNEKNSGVNNDVLSFAQDSSGRMWIGTYGGLYLYDEIQNSHRKFELQFNSSVLVDHRVTALAASEGQLVWVGFYRGGLQLIDVVNGKSYASNVENAGDMFVMDLFEDKAKNLWIATQSHGLIRVTSESTYYYYKSGVLPEKGVSIIFSGSDKPIFISTSNKIYEYDYEKNRFAVLEFDFGFGLDNAVIFSVGQSQNGDIWFGTKDHGLFQWRISDQKSKMLRLNHVGRETELEYATIYGIASDATGNLWCSTQNGVLMLSSSGQLIKRFTMTDGLQGGDFSFGASFTSQAGLIYFGGMNGYNRFDPNQIEINRSASAMRMTSITFPDQYDIRSLREMSDVKNLQLTHEDQFVKFQFSVLDFIDADKNQFRYKLENFDTQWIESGSRNTATYTNLPAGNYVLRVQGANSAGIWNRDGIKLDIQVLPAPWLTWWAYLSYCVALLSIAWGLHRIYHSYAIERLSAQMAREMFDAENKADDEMQEQLELQDEIVNSAYNHNITTLSLVNDCISARSINLPKNIRDSVMESSIRRVSALSSLEACLSYQAGGPVANLQKYTDLILIELLKDAPVRPETIVAINEVTTLPISAELASPISIILYELLENCIRHAFRLSSPANYIHVKLAPGIIGNLCSRFLCLSVQDSGIGVSDGIEYLGTESSGIAIVQSIVAKLGGSLHVSGDNGTQVLITIPDKS